MKDHPRQNKLLGWIGADLRSECLRGLAVLPDLHLRELRKQCRTPADQADTKILFSSSRCSPSVRPMSNLHRLRAILRCPAIGLRRRHDRPGPHCGSRRDGLGAVTRSEPEAGPRSPGRLARCKIMNNVGHRAALLVLAVIAGQWDPLGQAEFHRHTVARARGFRAAEANP